MFAVLAGASVAFATGQLFDPTFTYQGRLEQDGAAISDVCDMQFTLIEDTGGGTQEEVITFDSNPGTRDPIIVENGLFQAELDFSDFTIARGNPVFLEVSVRCPSGSVEPYTVLSPTLPITLAPRAGYAEVARTAETAEIAQSVSGIDGHSLDASDGSPSNALFVDADGNVGVGTTSPGSRLHLRNNESEIGVKLKASGSWTAELRQTDSSILSLINSNAERLSIAPSGHVGIGTTNPATRLDIVSAGDPMLTVRTSDESGDDAGIAIQGARNASTTADVAYVDFRDFDSDEGAAGTEFTMARIAGGLDATSGQRGGLRFHTNNGSGLGERMRLTASGDLGVGTASPQSLLHLSSPSVAALTIEADTDNANESDNARIVFSQDGGATRARVGFADGQNALEITNEQNNAIRLGVNNRTVFEVNSVVARYKNSVDANIINYGRSSADSGALELFGNNGNLNVLLSHADGNRGLLQVYDENEAAQAGVYVNGSGQGLVFGDLKNFRLANPDDPSTEICYAAVEGPEAAAYVRGTARLVDGYAEIVPPEHFAHVAVNEGMTVQLTPLSASSKGLAVVEKSVELIRVRELHDGNGSYEFDYLVTAVRKGYEDYEVIQPALGSAAAQRMQAAGRTLSHSAGGSMRE